MSVDASIKEGLLTAFKFTGKANLVHVNIRKEADGKEGDEVLAIDLKVNAIFNIDQINHLDTGLQGFLWSTEGIVRNTQIASVKIKSEIPDCYANVSGVQAYGVKVKDFSIDPLESLTARVTMKLTFKPTSTELATIAEFKGDEIDLEIGPTNEALAFVQD